MLEIIGIILLLIVAAIVAKVVSNKIVEATKKK